MTSQLFQKRICNLSYTKLDEALRGCWVLRCLWSKIVTIKCVILDLAIPQVKVNDKHGSFSSLASSDKSYSPAGSPRRGRKMIGQFDIFSLNPHSAAMNQGSR